MKYKLISFDLWKQFAKNYIKEYIKTHKIYRWIPSDVYWDNSGSVEEVKDDVLYYVSTLELSKFDDNFLCLLYNGISIASYVSGCGFFYETFSEALVNDLSSELFTRLSEINNINNDDEELVDELYDYITEIEEDWIHNIIVEFTKEKVLKVLKEREDKRLI